MKRVAIVTLDGNTNFGNKLQNFALQEAIRGASSAHVETLSGLPRREDKLVKARRRASGLLAGRLPQVGGRRVESAGESGWSVPDDADRRDAIGRFAATHISPAESVFSAHDPGEVARAYDCFVVGSDQVWNPAFTHGNREWFLNFAPAEKRVAYAASFGVPRIPAYLRRRYTDGLRGIPELSVREFGAADLVRELTGRDVPVVLDPTMLLQGSEWSEFASLPDQVPGSGYVFVFMLATLDGASGHDRHLSPVLRHAQENGWEIFDVNASISGRLLGWSPGDFIGAIKAAELVVTDSFHAAVFAHLFHRPFVIANRGNMNSRFETLVRHSGIEGVSLGSDGCVERATTIDWSRVDERLASRRIDSQAFLARALGG